LQYSQSGAIARQELGSMLPVAALTSAGCFDDCSVCLDLCASPGSKTLQALEVLITITAAKRSKFASLSKRSKFASLSKRTNKVMLVANDILKSRLEALQQAVERSGMHERMTSHITYTCQDATKFELRVSSKTESCDTPMTHSLLFDVILCDVPCSGDGTCRKDRHVLPQWKPAVANQLHATQLAILTRAIELLKPGGCVCYSTCSLNPIENEAVVAGAIQKFSTRGKKTKEASSDGTDNHAEQDLPLIELLNFPNIPGLILRNGISHWKVADFDDHTIDATLSSDAEDDSDAQGVSRLSWYETYEDAVANKSGGERMWARTMWPPPTPDTMPLSRCKRLWPQDQDSGGFFLALIRKNR
jgi:multisite-specific tRNA:(cytosine-C5)-methyltransferase